MTTEAAVAAYAGSVVGCPPDHVVAVRRYAQGENHAVHRVSYLDGAGVQRDVVVRVSNADAHGARTEREAAVLAQLAGRSSPRLLDVQAHGPLGGAPVMCLEHVQGDSASFATVTAEQLTQLGSAVKRVHEVPVAGLVDVLGGAADLPGYVAERLRGMLGRLPLVRDPLPQSLQGQFAATATWGREAADALRHDDASTSLCLLHGDVSPGNVLWAPHPVLIDWEYARLGDPADEIGYLFGQNALSAEGREAFWRGYAEGLDATSRAQVVDRAARWEPLTLFGSALYWTELWSRRVQADAEGRDCPAAPKEPAYYLGFTTRYLDRCDETRERLPRAER